MASTSSPVALAKRALRKNIKSRLSELTSTEIGRQSGEVTDRVVNLRQFKQATRVGVYLSMPKGEISTASIVRQALAQGKKVFVPFVQKSAGLSQSHSHMEMFALHSAEDLDDLKPDSWGIPILGEESLQGRENAMGGFGPSKGYGLASKNLFEGLDLILLPGMAFDHLGGRLGHGKGFYDRFLQKYSELASEKDIPAKMPSLVGLALKQQLLASESTVPTNADDWRVDLVITSS